MTSAPASPAIVARSTLRALAAPRRLLPVLVVALPLLYAQSRVRDTALLGVGLAMAIACVAIAPVTWRLLAGASPTTTRVLAYAAIGALVVAAIGSGVPRALHLRASFLTERSSLLVCAALYWVGGFGLGRGIELEESLAAQRARAEALAREAERAQLLALRAHLYPHFLFNTLNAIAEWCRMDGAVAEEAVLRLAAMLRALLAGVREERWPLERELDLARALFELHRLRDPDRFTVRVEAPTALGARRVPPLLLLPLAENAVKHGPAAGHAGEITVAVAKGGGRLRVTVSNPGPYTGPRPGSDGLPTVERRLTLAYGGRARLRVAPEGDRTVAVLDLPDEDA